MAHSFYKGAASSALRTFGRRFVGVVRAALPQRCELCVAPTGGRLLCGECDAALPRLPASCPTCALPSPHGSVCGACLTAPPPYALTVAALVYAFPTDRLLQNLKYGGRLALADWAAGALSVAAAAALARRPSATRPDRIVALPLAVSRQRERGFNQAREIAVRVAAALDLPAADLLRRTAGGPAQASLPWAERVTNVRGAFVAVNDPAGARIALVDDVMTTGATLAEAARTLLRAGAAHVECWVVARTLRPGQD
ncbi:MAG: ComF family protein [Betaproteobacteria bacterium]